MTVPLFVGRKKNLKGKQISRRVSKFTFPETEGTGSKQNNKFDFPLNRRRCTVRQAVSPPPRDSSTHALAQAH
jgi:hypothetical protein